MWPFNGDAELEAVQSRLEEAFGGVPNTYRALAHAPQFVNGWIDMAWMLRRDATVDEGVRELAITRKAYLDNGDYLWRHHWKLAVKAGVTPGKLEAVSHWRDSAEFTPAERAAFEMVDELTAECRLSPEVWQGLRQQFTDREAVELVVIVAWYSCVSQTLASLRVPLEDSLADVPPVPVKAGEGI
ncbi:MAG TPA: carboxymuconolactone decarboxylase family protein [Streptosporangiaceae bacterium]